MGRKNHCKHPHIKRHDIINKEYFEYDDTNNKVDELIKKEKQRIKNMNKK